MGLFMMFLNVGGNKKNFNKKLNILVHTVSTHKMQFIIITLSAFLLLNLSACGCGDESGPCEIITPPLTSTLCQLKSNINDIELLNNSTESCVMLQGEENGEYREVLKDVVQWIYKCEVNLSNIDCQYINDNISYIENCFYEKIYQSKVDDKIVDRIIEQFAVRMDSCFEAIHEYDEDYYNQ